MNPNRLLAGLLTIGLGVTALACNSEGPSPVTVSVTYKGEPVQDVRVNLLNSNGKSAFAFTDETGKAESFTSTAPGGGVLPGEYTMTLAPNQEIPASDAGAAAYAAPKTKLSFPKKYASDSSSDAKVNVTSDGNNEFQLELTD
ncbi:hypothetical protein [Bremerella alba]|uniref:Lipoprotein n=1 Tax=Bremerella alba TaxID=980252 RepID=A0A7V8V9Q0_9BACT|nr:hypothetical protein [Bremerella alba]MBA2117523.1 hypothetical protein [Bremerella alba]